MPWLLLVGIVLSLTVICLVGYVVWDRWDNQRNKREMHQVEKEYMLYSEWLESQKRVKSRTKPPSIQ